MSTPEIPAIVELEAVLVPENPEFYINRGRHIAVAMALFTETVSLYTVSVVGSADMMRFATTLFGLRDERGIEYPMVSSNSGGGSGGRAHDVCTSFRRPDRQRPLQLTAFWYTTGPGGTRLVGDDVVHCKVPLR